LFDKANQDREVIALLELIREHNEFSDPHDQLSKLIINALCENDDDKDSLDYEELSLIQAAMKQSDHIIPDPLDKER
jgi:hypothetical protein